MKELLDYWKLYLNIETSYHNIEISYRNIEKRYLDIEKDIWILKNQSLGVKKATKVL